MHADRRLPWRVPSPLRRRRRRRPGFTLVEAVLALAILATTVVVLASATAKCLAVIRMARHYHAARIVLEQAELEHPLVWSNSVSENTQEDVEYPGGFVFSRTLEATAEEPDLYIVTARVRWKESGRDSLEEVSYLFYCPSEDGVLP
jgi:Tfp pilus assembly protein PilE